MPMRSGRSTGAPERSRSLVVACAEVSLSARPGRTSDWARLNFWLV